MKFFIYHLWNFKVSILVGEADYNIFIKVINLVISLPFESS